MEKEIQQKIVNLHYIDIIREVNGYLKHEKIDISQDINIIIKEIKSLRDNRECTILDVQNRFVKSYPEDNFKKQRYDYLLPIEKRYKSGYTYASAYVCRVGYPRIMTSEEYKDDFAKYTEAFPEYKDLPKDLVNHERLLLEKIQKTKDILYKCSLSLNQRIREMQDGIEEMQEFKCRLYRMINYEEFIYAHNYTIKSDILKKDDNVKMYSTAQIGWKGFEYEINDDINISISTNFGYGSASYFFCNLRYKDINILPYSYVVRYYYAEMTHFIRYTRCYEPAPDSWDEVFEFTVETVNFAKREPKKFIQKWIVDEVEKMMEGLRDIMSEPDAQIEKFLNGDADTVSITDNYYTRYVVENCNDSDRKVYRAFPEEKVIAFRAEKISGSSMLLDNLRRLTEIAPIVTPYIEEIENMNKKIQPEIIKHIENITLNIKPLKYRFNTITEKLKTLNTLLKEHQKKIEQMGEKEGINEYIAESKYKDNHPEYTELEIQIDDLTKREKDLERDIKLRENFIVVLEKCKNRIKKHIKAA